MTFDEWTDDIARLVRAVMPSACVKRKVEDICRISFGAKECQMHAASDNEAHFVALNKTDMGEIPCPRPSLVRIGEASRDEVAARIVGWLQGPACRRPQPPLY